MLDGDRGGDLIQKELLQVTNVKFVGRAPRGKEIEECNCKEIAEAIENKVPVSELSGKPAPAPPAKKRCLNASKLKSQTQSPKQQKR